MYQGILKNLSNSNLPDITQKISCTVIYNQSFERSLMHLATISEMHAQLLAMLCNTKANVPPQPPPHPPPQKKWCVCFEAPS